LVLAEVRVAVKQVERLTERIGRERQAERDAATAVWLARPLAQREEPPAGLTAAAVAVVESDGGRLQICPGNDKPDQTKPANTPPATQAEGQPTPPATQAEGQPTPLAPAQPPDGTAEQSAAQPTPDEPSVATDRPGRSGHWREDKVGCLLQMSSSVSDVDPCPEIPTTFVDPLRTLALAQEIGGCAVPQGAPFQKTAPPGDEPAQEEAPKRPGRPEIVAQRVVASRQDVQGFGPLLAAAAWAMGLFSAARRAFVGDGSTTNWSIWKRYFARWVAVLDFVHALTYVYAAAMAGRSFPAGWPVYERWIRWVWGGQVSRVLPELTARQQELGKPTKEDKEGSPKRLVQETLTYLSNNQDKMRYDEYRKQGLPLMSSHIESMIKQINYRVKGTEKFWSEQGAEAILQLRADYLSDDEPLEAFWQRRQAAATGQRLYRRAG
jgi:hypothetical protein